jgi:hypothetical protein
LGSSWRSWRRNSSACRLLLLLLLLLVLLLLGGCKQRWGRCRSKDSHHSRMRLLHLF